MCRLIVAAGEFRTADILAAAEAMSCGRTADHDGPTDVHPNGWGAVWRQANAPYGLGRHRDVRPLTESVRESPVPDVASDFLAVHARHATLPKNHGPQFTHPLERPGGPSPWLFMHNGFLPTVHRLLGMEASEFDSREYFDYIVPTGARRLDEAETLARLNAIPRGGSSGNAIAVNPYSAYVIHWTMSDTVSPLYFGMFRLRTDRSLVIASEVITDLAPRHHWEPLKPGSVTKIPWTTGLVPRNRYDLEGAPAHAHD
ncbi:class II glutamine amidotransferase [Streptomyces sp. NPDC091266]|uniref:class II glutamine amidotransferase n=1 Tax=Streptomyces sp. NPDC091266 TaxID=3365978 RepID=UPI0038054A10